MKLNSKLNGLEILAPSATELLDLDNYRKSPNRGADASRPKRNYTSPQGEIYFKFDMTNNEICAELFAYDLAKRLGLDAAVTRLAKSGAVLGVASYDVSDYEEPTDEKSYSVKDFLSIDGFVFMCLSDYLIMNEDRHAGNWGISRGKVAPLFDHNKHPCENEKPTAKAGFSHIRRFCRKCLHKIYKITSKNFRLQKIHIL